MPLPAADRISARLSPYVHLPDAGRAASPIAHSAPPIAPTSDSMCPASDSSASDPDRDRGDHLGGHERSQQPKRDQQVAAVRTRCPPGLTRDITVRWR